MGRERMQGGDTMLIKKILVPIDFSESSKKAFDVACDLAYQMNAKICVLHAQDESALRAAVKEGLLTRRSSDIGLEAELELVNNIRFSEMISKRDVGSLELEYLYRRGDPGREIVSSAEEISANLIVMGTRGVTAMSRLMGALLGSVTEHVIRRSLCPVVLVRYGQE